MYVYARAVICFLNGKKSTCPVDEGSENCIYPMIKKSTRLSLMPQINDALWKENVENAKNVKTKMRKMLQLTFFAETFFRIFNVWAATWQNQQNECALSEDSDQPGHPPSLIWVFAVRSMVS